MVFLSPKMTEKLCRLTCYKSQCTTGDKVSKHHILTPVASPSAACVILAPHHRATHDPPHLPAAAPRPAMLHLHFKYRNLFY